MPPTVLRRLASMVYESLIVAAILFLGSAMGTLLAGGRITGLSQWALQALLVALLAGYFVTSWHRGGQTVAMRPWRLRATTARGEPLSVSRAGARFVASALVVGLSCAGAVYVYAHPGDPLGWAALAPGVVSVAWGFFDPQGRFLYDTLTGTKLVHERPAA